MPPHPRQTHIDHRQTTSKGDAISSNNRFLFEAPKPSDAEVIWQLVNDSGVLDANSSYCYLVLCKYFADTCVVVRREGRLAGFVTALIPPRDAGRLFVWQVGVSSADRGQGLAKRMLRYLLSQSACGAVTHIETTVSPGNAPSRALFAALARELETSLEECETYAPDFFPEPNHDPEQRLLLGPFDVSRLSAP